MLDHNTLDIDARREIAISVATGLEEIGGYGRGVVISGRSFSTAGALVTFIRSAGKADVDDIQRQLNVMESKALADTRRDVERQANEDARGQADPLFDLTLADIAEHQERAKYDASVEGKLDRLIEINTRIADALEKR